MIQLKEAEEYKLSIVDIMQEGASKYGESDDHLIVK